MSRIEHEHWDCPACSARGHCIECGSLGTREAYYAVQELHAAAIEDEEGIAAQVLERIELLPELRDRAFWVEAMLRGARQQLRVA